MKNARRFPLKLAIGALLTLLLGACANFSDTTQVTVYATGAAAVDKPVVVVTLPPPSAVKPAPVAPTGAGVSAAALPWKPDNLIPVLFATNRNRTGVEIPYYFYGNDLVDESHESELRRGIALIKVPPRHQRGEIKRPGWVAVTLERMSDSPLARAFSVPRMRAEDPETEFSYAQNIQELSQPQFDEALKQAIHRSRNKTAVLYVHGYANDFTDAAFRTAQIAFDLATPDYELVPLMFSWPSDPGITGMNYDKARNKQSRISGYDLARFLKEIAANTDIGTVHIIAHSMGAEVLGFAIEKLGLAGMGQAQAGKPVQPVFRQIVFAAPDVTPRIFGEVIEPAIASGHLVTTYGASTDLPLWLSSIKSREARIGRVAPGTRLPECVDTVDVTAVTSRGGLSHSTWAESPRVLDDLRLVLRDGLTPSLRGLVRRDRAVWALPAKAAHPRLASQPASEHPALRGCGQDSARP